MSRIEATVDLLAAAGWLAPLDVHTSRLLADLAAEGDPTVRLALALASRQLRLGHLCLEVHRTAAAAGPVDDEGQPVADLAWPAVGPWLAALAASPLVATVPDRSPPGATPVEPVPLVLELPSGRLYLRRWWEHEASLAESLISRASELAAHDATGLQAGLARLFPPVDGLADAGRRDQATAAALAVRRRLAVITGGPGTGKTTTVVRLLALLVEQAGQARQAAPRVLLLAPTGKAAARLEESIVAARGHLPVDDAVRDAIPADAQTIHRALGPRPDGSWRRGRADPLAADVVVVDEASMIDVALMRALVDAVRPEARLVILGDRDQLASVEAGAVLADLCGDGAAHQPIAVRGNRAANPPTADGDDTMSEEYAPSAAGGSVPTATNVGSAAGAVESTTPPITACIARLSYSFRFGSDTGIGALAKAINAGDADAALGVLADPAVFDVALVTAPPVAANGRLHPTLAELVKAGYGAYLNALGEADSVALSKGVANMRGAVTAATDAGAIAGDPIGVGPLSAALAALGQFRVLCAHRRGPNGVGAVGTAVIESLARAGRLSPVGEHWRGRLLMVTRNDDTLRLYNGDVGLIAPGPASDGHLRAYFPGPDGHPRAIAPPRLPPHETVFAMSIHKSQGSEFQRVAIVLPDAGSPLLTRELLYTAVTRARDSLTLFADPDAVRAALGRRVARASGLGERLWGAPT